ncbi:LysR family transcriptional regulator [Vibrio variabilis]|uniref:LysR family transcriptional regulator n=1 Tax=Vibrio variabilis TaxID=990271 RepID=UPI000DDA61DA|nr:LysR family transcriptional regulator [Vibrio variabilis]
MLFEREGKYPQITEAGLALYDSAKVVVDSTERFAFSARQLSKGIPATLVMGIDEDLPLAPFSELFHSVQKRWPNLNLVLKRQAAPKLFKEVKNSNVHIAITPTLQGSSQFYEFRAVGQWPYKMACGADHELSRSRNITNDQLAAFTQILPTSLDPNSPFMQTQKMSPYTWLAEGYDSLCSLLKANIGWAFLPVYGSDLPEGVKEIFPEFSLVDMHMQYDIIWPKGQRTTELHHCIIDQVHAAFSQRV